MELELHIADRKYLIVREFDDRGELRAAAIREDGRLLVTGEKRDEERVSETVSHILGMTYDRMVSSVIIPQGEIDAILKSDPKELKELFDDMIGLRTFDMAYERMKRVLEGFRERVRKATGRFPEDAKSVEQELESALQALKGEKEGIRKQLEEIRKELNVLPMGSSGAKSLDELRGEARRRAEPLRDMARETRLSVQVHHIASMFQVYFTDRRVRNYSDTLSTDVRKFKSLFISLLRRRVFIPPSNFEACFL